MNKTLIWGAKVWNDFVSLFFPRLCLACEQPLPYQEPFLCYHCQLKLPETNFHLSVSNPFTQYFEGRVTLENAAALFFFSYKTPVQHLIHQIKYHGKKEVAVELGRLFGVKLAKTTHFQGIDCIVPVPMHPTKQRWRGYNQAEMIALGLSNAMNIPLDKTALCKTKLTISQTQLSKWERFENTQDIFELIDIDAFKGKHILIVDDVMTTGATLEGCAYAILKEAKDVKISFATLAYVTR